MASYIETWTVHVPYSLNLSSELNEMVVTGIYDDPDKHKETQKKLVKTA